MIALMLSIAFAGQDADAKAAYDGLTAAKKKTVFSKYKVAVAKKMDEPLASVAEAFGVPAATIQMVVDELTRNKGRTGREAIAKKAGVSIDKPGGIKTAEIHRNDMGMVFASFRMAVESSVDSGGTAQSRRAKESFQLSWGRASNKKTVGSVGITLEFEDRSDHLATGKRVTALIDGASVGFGPAERSGDPFNLEGRSGKFESYYVYRISQEQLTALATCKSLRFDFGEYPVPFTADQLAELQRFLKKYPSYGAASGK